MNHEFIDKNGRPAPSSIVWGGRRIANPSEAQLLAAGYHKRELVQVEEEDVEVDREATIATLKSQIDSLTYDISVLREQINELESEV